MKIKYILGLYKICITNGECVESIFMYNRLQYIMKFNYGKEIYHNDDVFKSILKNIFVYKYAMKANYYDNLLKALMKKQIEFHDDVDNEYCYCLYGCKNRHIPTNINVYAYSDKEKLAILECGATYFKENIYSYYTSDNKHFCYIINNFKIHSYKTN